MMRITDVKVTLVSVKSKDGGTPNTWGVQRGTSAGIVQVFTDEGLIGIGETMESLTDIYKHIIDTRLRPLMIGEDPRNVERLCIKLRGLTGARWLMRAFVGAISGVEMALWDIAARASGQPLCMLLGGRLRDEVRWAALQWLYSPEEMARRAKDAVDQGFRTIKLRVGLKPEQDIANVAKVREAVGKSVRIRIDANQAWTPGFAVKMIKELEPFGLEYVEQPVMLEDLEGLRMVRSKVDVPIAANESAWTIFDISNVVRTGAADIILLDPHFAGGLWEVKKAAAIAEGAGIPVVMHASGELGVAFSAYMHVIASTPNFIYDNDEGYLRHEGDIVREKITFVNGATQVPTKPGIGVEVDPAKLEEHSLEYQAEGGEYYFANEKGPQGGVPFLPRY